MLTSVGNKTTVISYDVDVCFFAVVVLAAPVVHAAAPRHDPLPTTDMPTMGFCGKSTTKITQFTSRVNG